MSNPENPFKVVGGFLFFPYNGRDRCLNLSDGSEHGRPLSCSVDATMEQFEAALSK